MELVLPKNYVEIEQEEMMYLDGGASIITTAGIARTSFNVLSTASTAAVALAADFGQLGGIMSRVVGRVVGRLAGTWFNALQINSNQAFHQASEIVASAGINRRVRATITANWLGLITAASVVKV